MFYEDVTNGILKSFYHVYNALGHGFLEKVYRRALVKELKRLDFPVEEECRINVFYYGEEVGEYFADIVVDDSVIIELKAADALRPEHCAQLINYLKATEKELGLLLNFGTKPDFKRILFTNDKKTHLMHREEVRQENNLQH